MKVTVAKTILVVEQEVDVPEKCPECGADLMEDGQLHEYVLSATGFNGSLFKGKKRDDDGFDTGEDENFASYEESFPTGYKCNNCDHELVERTEPDFTDDDGSEEAEEEEEEEAEG